MKMYEIDYKRDLMNRYDGVDIYFLAGGRYGLYKARGTAFDDTRLKSGRYPDRLFISLDDRMDMVMNGTKKANARLRDRLREKGEEACEVFREVLSIALSEPRSEVLNCLTETIDIVVDEYLKTPAVLGNLSLVSEKDYSTHIHLTNVMLFCIGYAHFCGYSPEELKRFGLMGLLHDVGKVDIPSRILQAPRKLTGKEFGVIKTHPEAGWKILRSCDFHESILRGALEHHEKLDGSGYPEGKRAEGIPEYSRALAIIDIFEALTTWRPYKKQLPVVSALAILKQEVLAGKLDGGIFARFAYSIVGHSLKRDGDKSYAQGVPN